MRRWLVWLWEMVWPPVLLLICLAALAAAFALGLWAVYRWWRLTVYHEPL